MTQILRRNLLALMLGVTTLTIALPLTHFSVAHAEDGDSDKGGSNDDVSDGDDDSDHGGDDDDGNVGAVGGAGGVFQEGCAVTDTACLKALKVK